MDKLFAEFIPVSLCIELRAWRLTALLKNNSDEKPLDY